MKNIHVIPTDKTSRLILQGSELVLSKYMEVNEGFSEFNQHIYITSDEEIKEGDWFIRDGSIHKCFKVHKTDIEFLTSIDSVYCGSNTFWSKEFCKKIILTTDQDLINDGVQAIDDDFLEWFVQNPSCEEVKVKNVFKSSPIGFGNAFDYYKIIIPKEEPTEEAKQRAANYMRLKGALEPKQEKDDSYIKEQKERRRKLFNLIDELEEKKLQEEPKQETLEEVAERLWLDSTSQLTSKNSFIQGAKWQQERMYSEEEVLELLQKALTHKDNGETGNLITAQGEIRTANFYSWFEQNKKK